MICYAYTTSPRRLNTLSEIKCNMHVECGSFVFNNFAQPKAGLYIKQLIPAAVAAAFISVRDQSKRVLYWL